MASASRPIGVTLVGYYLVLTSPAALIVRFAGAAYQRYYEALDQSMAVGQTLPLDVRALASLTMSAVGLTLLFVAGIAVLGAATWGRWVVVVYPPVSFAIGALLHGFSPIMLGQVVIWVLMVFALTRPAAVAWFSSQPVPANPGTG